MKIICWVLLLMILCGSDEDFLLRVCSHSQGKGLRVTKMPYSLPNIYIIISYFYVSVLCDDRKNEQG